MERINAGNYDYVIMSEATQDSPETEYFYPLYIWVRNDPALVKKVEEPNIVPEADYVFKGEGKMDPKYCPSPAAEEKALEEVEQEKVEAEEAEEEKQAREEAEGAEPTEGEQSEAEGGEEAEGE